MILIKKITFSERAYRIISGVVEKSGRKRLFSTVVSFLIEDKLDEIEYLVTAGEKRDVARLIDLLDRKDYKRLRSELLEKYKAHAGKM